MTLRKIFLLGVLFLFVSISYSQNSTISDSYFQITNEQILISENGVLNSQGDINCSDDFNKNVEGSVDSFKSGQSGNGETLGSLDVSLTGAATYLIPIAVPPGINGVQPELSLYYNSQVGDGVAGYGWNIKGISNITRIPATTFHDDTIDGVDFDSTDRFALDGERLILKSGTYGSDGAEYQTENFSNLKIKSFGISSFGSEYGPAHFKVYYPDGSIAVYGDGNYSSTKLNYSITYWENKQGIRVDYNYTNYSSSGLTIESIQYGGTNSTNHLNKIQFQFASNTRESQAFVNGESFKEIKNLTAIIVNGKNQSTLFRKYNLVYGNSSKLSYSRLKEVEEISKDGLTAHTSVKFNYGETDLNSISYLTGNLFTGLQNVNSSNAKSFSLDFSGNGKSDFVVYPETKDKIYFFEDFENSTSQFYNYVTINGYFKEVFASTILNASNKVIEGQGITLIKEDSSNHQYNFISYSNNAPPSSGLGIAHEYNKQWDAPTYFTQSGLNNPEEVNIPQELISGDFDGDGLTDVVAIGKPYTETTCYEVSCGDGGIGGANTNLGSGNGDGDDICINCDNVRRVNKSVHFIKLKRDLTNNFVSSIGNLQDELKEDDVLQTGDFNGDGKTDLMHLTDGKATIYSLQNGLFSQLWTINDFRLKTFLPQLMGDYNGDGKTDFMMPRLNDADLFAMFLSTGQGFVTHNRAHPFEYKATTLNEGNGRFDSYDLLPIDSNGDGRTDIVQVHTAVFSSSTPDYQGITEYLNLGIVPGGNEARIGFDTTGAVSQRFVPLEYFPIPIYFNASSINKFSGFAYISGDSFHQYEFDYSHQQDMALKSVLNNGVKYNIDYGPLSINELNSDNLNYYFSSNEDVYPDVNIEISRGTRVVTKLTRQSSINNSDIVPIRQMYYYQGATYNAQGIGFLGFKGFARSNWHSDHSDRLFTVMKFDTSKRGALIEEYTQENYFSFNSNISSFLSKTDYSYHTILQANKVFKMQLTSKSMDDRINGVVSLSNLDQYDIYNNPQYITSSILDSSGNNAVHKTQTIEYENIDNGNDYFIGRIKKNITSNIRGTDTFNAEQQFVYSSNLLIQLKTKGNGTAFDLEDFEYDSLGNITRKVITPDGESPREISFTYDSSGRFLATSTNVRNQTTYYDYDSSSGNVLESIDPQGLDSFYEYDEWERLQTFTDYLGNKASTSYVENTDFEYTVTNTSDEGTNSVTEYDALGRVVRVKETNSFGAWVNISFEYDDLDRPIRQSEPYIGNSPSQWNETLYDIYGRPIRQTLYTGRVINITYNGLSTTVNDGVKTVTTVTDPVGNTISVTDPGGTITYDYYANNALKSSSYNGNVTSVEQDGWGRRTKLIDPSAGTYTYEYNGFGELLTENTPKGSTSYEYNEDGSLNEKEISGDHLEMYLSYEYDSNSKFLNSINVSNIDGNNIQYSYSYDNYSRLNSITESNPYATFSQLYTYDSFGRVNTEEYDAVLLSNGKSSSKKIKNIYQNGVLKGILDFDSNSNIWELQSLNARGQVTSSRSGNSMQSSNIFDSFGFLQESSVATSSVLMSLVTEFNPQRGTLDNRSNSMFSWSETFGYDQLDRLITFNDNDSNQSHQYDNTGRIIENSTVGTYSYLNSSYQLDNVDLNNQGDIYYQQNSLQQVKYNGLKKPFEINEEGKEKISFQYNGFLGRSHMFYGGMEDDIYARNNRKHYSSSGIMEISYDSNTNSTTFVTYIGGDAYSAPAIWKSEESILTGTTSGYYYLHRDYLGSIMLITDGDGVAKEKRHFDAWGNTVKITDGNGNDLDKLTFLDRGYTGHEHLNGVKLIHMNGRLYDPNLKRFLSPDNYVQDMGNTQNYNRYGYVLNNPLMYVDPSGEEWVYGSDSRGNFNYSSGGGTPINIDNETLNWASNNFKSAIKDYGNGIQSISDGVRDFFRSVRNIFKKKEAPIREYSNNQNLDSDPFSSTNQMNQQSTFSATGTDSGGLGIKRHVFNGLEFHRGFNEGFANGIMSSVNFIKSLGTEQGWSDMWTGTKAMLDQASTPLGGALFYAQAAHGVANYVGNIPSMSAYEMGHDVGFGTEKVVEAVLISKGTGFAVNTLRGATAAVIADGAISTGAAVESTGIVAANGTRVSGFGRHALNRAIGSAGRMGVKPSGILDALKNPLKINKVITDQLGRPSQRLIGRTGEVVINPSSGYIISVNPTSTKKLARLLRQLEGN